MPYEGEPGAWPADERSGSFAVLDLRDLADNAHRRHLPALIAATFIAFLVIPTKGLEPTTF